MKKFALIVIAAIMAVLGIVMPILAAFAAVSVVMGIVYIAQDIARLFKKRIEEQ